MADYSALTLEELKDRCRHVGIRAVGKAPTLIRKLIEHDKQKEAAAVIENARFKVYSRTLMGKIFTIYCEQMTTIGELKSRIYEESGVLTHQQTLFLYCDDPPKLGDLIFHDGRTGKKISGDDGATLAERGTFN